MGSMLMAVSAQNAQSVLAEEHCNGCAPDRLPTLSRRAHPPSRAERRGLWRLATRMLVDFCHACVYAEKATSIWHRRLVKRPLEDTFIFKEAWSDALQKRSLFERRSVQQFTLAFRIEKWLWTPRIQYVVLCFGHLGVAGRTDRRQLNG